MHSARNTSSLARTRDLIHSKQDVAFIQTEEQKNIRMQMMHIRLSMHKQAPPEHPHAHHAKNLQCKHRILIKKQNKRHSPSVPIQQKKVEDKASQMPSLNEIRYVKLA